MKWVQVVPAVGRVTFSELLRDRVLYNVLLCAFLLLGLGFLVSRLSFAAPLRILIDFGVSALDLSGSLMAILFGAGLLGREFERRTIYLALSHPISRPAFVWGKFAGLAGLLALNWLLLSAALCGILLYLSGGQFGLVGGAFPVALLLGLIQMLFLGGLAIFFSSFTTTSLAVVFSIGVYLIGNNTSEIRGLVAKLEPSVMKTLLEGVSTGLPNLEHFRLDEVLTYDLPVPPGFLLTALLYGGILTALFLVLAGWIVHRREV